MIEKPIVLILGAGASIEFQYPSDRGFCYYRFGK